MRTEVEIQRVGQVGQGVGYDPDGNIYFVPGALPGDRVKVEYAAAGAKKYRDAELVEIVRPSPERREPACRYFNQCGGCDWLNWDYAAQVRAKDLMLRHTLERGQLQPRKFLPFVAADETFGYRNRIQVRRDGSHLGFLRRRTNEIVDVERCLVAHPSLNQELSALRREPPPPAGSLRKYELFVGKDNRVLRVQDMPHGAAGFAQINEAQNEKLKAMVARAVKESGGRLVLELFCGNGNLTFSYLPDVEHVIAVDSNENACEAARKQRDEVYEREAAGRTHDVKPSPVAFLTSFVNRAMLRKLPPDFRGQYDTLVLDPPRAGIGPALAQFVHPKLKNVIYVSCSPISFSQDVQCLKKEFTLEDVQGIDMFPHTRHVELVARFSR